MPRITSSLLTASWVLALAALFVVPSLKPENASELIPPQTQSAGEPSDPNAFIIVCPESPTFTAYELAGSVMVIAATVLWLISVGLMVRDRDRIIRMFAKEAIARVRRIEKHWQPSFR